MERALMKQMKAEAEAMADDEVYIRNPS